MNTQLIGFLINFIDIFRNLVVFAIIGRVLVSWFSMGNPGVRGRISQILYEVTDPLINLVKKIPHKVGMIDFSPLIALLAVDLLSELLIIFLVNLV